MAGVFGGANTRDLGAGAKQCEGHFAGHHVDFIGVGQRDDDVGIGTAGGLEHAGIRGVAGHSANIEAILQVAQYFLIGIDHRHFIRFFARQLVRRRPAHLAGAENDNLHSGLFYDVRS